jgi:hypothetical protein
MSTSTSGISSITSSVTEKIPSYDWFLKYMAGLKPDEVLTPEKSADLTSCAIKYGGAFLMLIISAITIYVASTDDKVLTEGFFKYMFFLIIPIIIASAIILPIFSQKLNYTTAIMNGTMLIVLFLSVYLFYSIKSPESVLYMKYSLYGFIVLSLIIGLAILYKLLIRYIYNSRGIVSVILQFVFFIPCLLLDLIEYIKYELNIAPKTVHVLLALELFVIIAYMSISRIFSAKPKSTTTNILLKEPVFLNKETRIGDNKIFAVDNVTEQPTDSRATIAEIISRKNFAVSFWAFMNQINSTKTVVFRIGRPKSFIGVPSIIYVNGNYEFYLQKGQVSPDLQIKLPIQKWNHFVLSYNENKVDVFLNGNLEKTISITQSPNHTNVDIISVGNEQSMNNVGAICNVRYYTNPISQYEIVSEHNLLMYSNPPIYT